MFKDIISGAVLFALSASYYYAATKFPVSALDTSVTASAFPELIGMLGACLSALLIVQGVWKATRQPAVSRTAGGEDADDDLLRNWTMHRAALGLLAIISVFLMILNPLGYPVALALLIFAVSTYQGIPISWKSAAVAVGGGILFWLFFVQFLQIHMPVGFWQHFASWAQRLVA